MNGRNHEILPLAQPLTGRELEVLTHIGEGLTNREIAEQMTVALSTVKWYVRQIYNKLGVQNRAEAIIRAKNLGLLPDKETADKYLLNIPSQITSFVGRRREISEVRQLLMTSRLVTLTGPGGCGKTRLAIEAARESAGQFGDGVFFVSLASTIEPNLVPNTIAQELGIIEQANTQLIDSLRSYFADKQILLLIDNFEHVLDAASLLSDLLSVAPKLTALITSQEALHLSGEYEYLVPPMSIPDPLRIGSVKDLPKYESVTLFAKRAEAVSTHFALTDENAKTIATICSRLDGLPLAIELAAARVKLFTPQQLLERLESRLGMLTGGPRDLPARQRTLRNTIDWSYELLNEHEETLFARLGVFSGGGSLKAIEAINSPGLGIDLLDGLESLLNKSLIYQQEDSSGEPRFDMLETLHEYAQERLALSGEMESARNRHLEFFLDLMEEVEAKLQGEEQVTWLKRLDFEYDNLLAAWEWSQSSDDMAGLGLRLIGAMAAYFDLRNQFNLGRELLSAALSAKMNSQPTAERAKALRKAGLLAYMQGDYPATRSLLEESISIYHNLGISHRGGLADALISLGDMETELGDYATASSLMKEALEIARQSDDTKGVGRAYWQLGACAVRPGNYEEAVFYFEKALPILRQIGDRTNTGIALSGLAEVAIRQGDYERAIVFENESLALRREIGEKWGIAVSLGNFSWIALRKGELNEATDLLGESIKLRNEIGDVGGVAWCLEKLAESAIISSPESRSQSKEYVRAAILFGAAATLRAPAASAIDLVDEPEHERQLEEVKGKLNESTFEKAWTTGESMTLEQAVEYALEG